MSETASASIIGTLVKGAEVPSSFSTLREQAVSFLSENGIPDKKHEDWKYTDIKRLFRNGLSMVGNSGEKPDHQTLDFQNIVRIGLVNGQLDDALPEMEGIDIYSVNNRPHAMLGSSAVHSRQEMAALNTALFQDGLVIRVHARHQATSTLLIDHLVHLGKNQIANPRILLILEDDARLSCIHHFVDAESSEQSLLNHVTEVFMGANARLEMNVFQNVGRGNVVNTVDVSCSRNSSFTSNTVQLGGNILRNNLNVRLNQENAAAHLHGFYMINGRELFDNHTLVEHVAPNCESNEVYRGLLAKESTGVFNGRVLVHPNAQKTNAFQKNNSILLGEKATMNAKPELEIYADDVKCSHGCTTGQLDEDAVFYLRARGLDKFGAVALLLAAFTTDVIKNISHPQFKALLEERIQARLKQMRE